MYSQQQNPYQREIDQIDQELQKILRDRQYIDKREMELNSKKQALQRSVTTWEARQSQAADLERRTREMKDDLGGFKKAA
jgi:DNA repair exonuclease SbcCD ATPase subunit